MTLPLSLPGIAAGVALVFIPSVGEYVIPELLGGPGAQLIGRVMWEEFFENRDWPMAAALAWLLLMVLVVVPVCVRARCGRDAVQVAKVKQADIGRTADAQSPSDETHEGRAKELSRAVR